jgi:phosphate transport system permease protein
VTTTAATATTAPVPAGSGARGQSRRRTRNRLFWGLCGLALLLIIAPVLSILVSLFHQAAPSLSWSLFTTPTKGAGGGLENAILGTLLLLLGVLIIAGTVGVATGVYLAEYAPARMGGVLRFLSEVLSGTPSIVIGYVGYLALVIGFHWQNSLLAALLALSVLVLPIIVKNTEVALNTVPSALREAAAGLGLSRTLTVGRILLPVALPGIVSGIIVALAISTGETAPLLFTAGFLDGRNPGFQLLHHPVPYLTYVTYTNISQPGVKAHQLAAAAGAVTMILLLVLIALSRLVSRRARKATERMSL